MTFCICCPSSSFLSAMTGGDGGGLQSLGRRRPIGARSSTESTRRSSTRESSQHVGSGSVVTQPPPAAHSQLLWKVWEKEGKKKQCYKKLCYSDLWHFFQILWWSAKEVQRTKNVVQFLWTKRHHKNPWHEHFLFGFMIKWSNRLDWFPMQQCESHKPEYFWWFLWQIIMICPFLWWDWTRPWQMTGQHCDHLPAFWSVWQNKLSWNLFWECLFINDIEHQLV